LTISDRDLADLAYSVLLDIHKEKLDGQEFLDISRLLQKALTNENRLKESKSSQKTNEKSNCPIYYASDYSDDEGNDVLTAEFVLPRQNIRLFQLCKTDATRGFPKD
jgi:ethanolamine utilization protein EutA (predicted chaperonin)